MLILLNQIISLKILQCHQIFTTRLTHMTQILFKKVIINQYIKNMLNFLLLLLFLPYIVF